MRYCLAPMIAMIRSLLRHKLCVAPFQSHQPLMRAALDDLSLLQNDNLVAIPDRAEAMRNDDAGAASAA